MSSSSHLPNDRRLSSWRSVIKAYQSCDRQFEIMLGECGLTTTQFDALSAIEALGGSAKLSDVAARLLVTKGNVTGLIQRLQAHELVDTESGASDRRVTVCRLTREGKKRLAKAQSAATQFVEYQLSPFSDEECGVVEDVMRRMIRRLESMDARALAGSAIPRAARSA
jgi:DNA-binding MarR family transcriptional regulator